MGRRVPYLQQVELADCGAACLAMVLAYHGRHVPLKEVRDATGTGRDGVDAEGLVRAARHYGLDARGVRADVDDLRHLPSGSILHWEFTHFVVLERVRRNTVDLVDPAVGRLRLPISRIGRSFTGAAIVLEPTADLAAQDPAPKGLLRYLRPMLRQSRLLRRIVMTSVLLRVFALAIPGLTAVLVNRVVPDGDRGLLWVVGAAAATMVAYHFLTSFLRAHLLLRLRTHLDMQMTLGFMRHLVDLPYGFFLRRSAGDLMMRLRSNSTVREILTTGAISTVLDGAFVAVYLVLLLALSPSMGLLVLGLGMLQAAVLLVARRRNQQLMAETLHTEARSQSYVYEMLAGVEALKAAGVEHRAVETWSNLFVDEVNVALRRGRLDALVDSVMTALRLVSPLALLVLGGRQVLAGDLRLGTMLALVGLAAGFLEPLAALVTTGLEVQQLGSYLDRINDVLDTPKEQDGRDVQPAGSLAGHIVAERVSFRYSSLGPLAVDDASLEISPGQTVAIVGRSGSGKSTFAHLLLGLYEPEAGRILYDGRDLASLEARSVRNQIGIVTQNAYVFGSTIRDNVALSDPAVSREEVERAARLACIHDEIVALPMGYDTVLVDGGASLSGGQRQRIAIARALVHRPSVVLLDEATSALDAITERAVYENLAGLGSTIVVIAHRLSTISRADLIAVMKDGRVVELGSHADLVGRGGHYQELVGAQSPPGT
ncbi:MAG: ATP-binding cassette, subfamily bacterial [Actinomycetota bacterium]|nr:ATP-binding cassette, subfamily bacterial [Actinomycetota bacterium]